jgi:glycosyltransferase involved in cell wall biosynthesis
VLDVSIIIPAYNAAATIAGTLASLAVQVPAGVEVIVADNGSTDATPHVVREWEKRMPLRIVDASQRRGQGAARNIAALEARGRMLVFTDADDIPLAGWVDAWTRLDGSVQFAGGPVVWFSDAHPVTHDPQDLPGALPMHMGVPFALGANMAVSRLLLLEQGGFDESMPPAEDVELSFRLLSSGVELVFARRAVLAKRERTGTRDVLRQYYAYGRQDPALYRRYGGGLLTRPTRGQVIRSYAGLVARTPLLWHPVHRKNWAHQAGRRAGRIAGSVRSRSLYL